jgi:P27 family predicted phage terminase small subunit
MRVVTTADAVALGMLCDALAKYDLAKGIVEAEGIIAVGRDGTIREHPASRTQDSAAERIVRLCREFGLTPSARAVVKVPDQKPPEDNDISRFLRLA